MQSGEQSRNKPIVFSIDYAPLEAEDAILELGSVVARNGVRRDGPRRCASGRASCARSSCTARGSLTWCLGTELPRVALAASIGNRGRSCHHEWRFETPLRDCILCSTASSQHPETRHSETLHIRHDRIRNPPACSVLCRIKLLLGQCVLPEAFRVSLGAMLRGCAFRSSSWPCHP